MTSMTTPPSPCGHLERGVADLARLLLEDRADQLLLGGQLGLALRRHLADQQVAGADLGADADDAALVEVAQRLLGAVRDVAGDLLVAELRRARVDLVLLDVDRGELVVLDEALGEDDRVLEVVALPGHEGDQQFLPSAISPPSVEEPSASTSPFVDLVAERRRRGFWWMSVPWFERMNLVSGYSSRVPLPSTTICSASTSIDLAVVARRGRRRRCRPRRGAPCRCRSAAPRVQQRHGLALHVRAHQRAVRVVVLEERDQRRRDRPDLRRRDVHEVDVLRRGAITASPAARAAEDLRP